MLGALLKPRFMLREYWPWLVGVAVTALLELRQPETFQQLTAACQQLLLSQPLSAPSQLPLAASLPLSVVLTWLPQPWCRRHEAGSNFLVCMLCLCLPLVLAAGLQLNALGYAPFAAMAGLWVGISLNFVRQLREAQRTLLRARRHAAITLDAIADAVLNVAPEGTLRSMNPAATALVARQQGHIGQHLCVALNLPGKVARQLEEVILQCVEARAIVRAEQPLAVAAHQMRVTAGPIFDAQGMVEEVVLVFSDVSESVAMQAQLYHDATHDPLTGLPNRGLLSRYIAEAISTAMQSEQIAAVLFVDIDHFSRINGSFGHYIGDAILIEVAHRLQEVVGHVDRVARWSGDEYVVLLDTLPDRDAVVKRVEAIHAAMETAMNIKGATLRVSCSIGISIAPADSINVDELLAMADTAMGRSKADGGGGYRFFGRAMSLLGGPAIDIESALRHALQHNEFDLYFQPQISLKTGQMIGMEALLRWARPGRGMVPPDHFIPVAEEIGLIIDIGVWALHRAAQQLRHWIDAGLPVVPISVNISARQCLDNRITRVIADAVSYAGISTDLLKIELTEATAMSNVDHVASLLRGVHGLGVRISVDDFGTGYSSLSFLKRFPISQLKIDRSFVHDITIDPDDAAIVSGTIALARGLDIEVVAEGVETDAQLAFLRARGCDIAQGFLFSQPLTEAEARTALARGPAHEWFTQPASATPVQ